MKATITIEDNDNGNANVSISMQGVGPNSPDTDGSMLLAAVLEAIKEHGTVVGTPTVTVA